MSIARTALRAIFLSSFFLAPSAWAYETELEPDSLTFLAGPEGQMRILIPVPLLGACDVPWCTDPECERDCALDFSILSRYRLEIALDGEESSQTIELAAYPVTTYWDPDSVSWDFPWEKPGGDLFLSPDGWVDEQILRSGKMKTFLRFRVLDAVLEAADAGLPVYGFAITTPIPRDLDESEEGLLPQEVAAIGKMKSIHFKLDFDLGLGPDPQPPIEVIVVDPPPLPPPLPPSDTKVKVGSIPGGKPKGPVIKPPSPPPPPPPPTPTAEMEAPDPPPPSPTPTVERKVPDPPPPPPVAEKETPDTPPAKATPEEKKAPDPPKLKDQPAEEPVGD